jgi:protein phosphatase
MVAVLPAPQHGLVHVAHVGDSRCYRMRQGRLELLTMDHSLANEVLELRPDLPEEDSVNLPRNVITRALGMSEALRVSVRTLDLAPLDRFVLCSDGLTDVLGDDEIAEVLSTTDGASETARMLVTRALAAPADDNIAVVVVRVDAHRGVSAIPKRHATRPPPAPRRASRPAPRSDDDAEIIMVDDESDTSDPEILVVPAAAGRREVVAAVKGRFPRPQPRSVLESGRLPEEPTTDERRALEDEENGSGE